MTDDPANEIKEDSLAANRQQWRDQNEQAADHPPTGAPKKASLLRALAEEALEKGNPVLVIPLDAAAPEDELPDSGEEQDHDLKLPKNTTVIFSNRESLPALSTSGPAGKIKVLEKRGDLGEQARKSACSSGPASPDTPVRVVDPKAPDSLRWKPLQIKGKLFIAHNVTLASSGDGKAHTRGKRTAEKKRLSGDEVKHLNTANTGEESR